MIWIWNFQILQIFIILSLNILYKILLFTYWNEQLQLHLILKCCLQFFTIFDILIFKCNWIKYIFLNKIFSLKLLLHKLVHIQSCSKKQGLKTIIYFVCGGLPLFYIVNDKTCKFLVTKIYLFSIPLHIKGSFIFSIESVNCFILTNYFITNQIKLFD